MTTALVGFIFFLVFPGIQPTLEPSEEWETEDFTGLLINQLERDKPYNWLISPVGVASVLGMLFYGAVNETRNEIREVLDLSNDTKEINEQFFQVFRRLKTNITSHGAWINFNNIILVQTLIKESYIEKMKSDFGIVIQTHIAPVKVPGLKGKQKTFNKFLKSGKTGLYPGIVIRNVAFFENSWLFPFESSKTEKSCFYSIPDVCSVVYFLTLVGDFYYTTSEEIQSTVLELPFKDLNFNMVFVLPFPGVSLGTVIELLGEHSINEIVDSSEMMLVDVMVPKFEEKFELNLTETLKRLDINRLFTPKVQLPGMFVDKSEAISQIIQTSVISIKEKTTFLGTKTGDTKADAVLKRSSPMPFFAKSPFLYFLTYRSQDILFAGQMVQPSFI